MKHKLATKMRPDRVSNATHVWKKFLWCQDEGAKLMIKDEDEEVSPQTGTLIKLNKLMV